jgi:valyl-tRNA synthetase
LPDAAREATWWTLVESLDVFVRLLHPVMPFVTEALWASLPHAVDDPELAIVAPWPVPSARDSAAEADVDAILDLVTRIRNARVEAGVPAAAWLDARLAAPGAANDVVRELLPQIEKLARIKATLLDASVSMIAAPGALSVVAGRLEAALEPHADPEIRAREHERLARELVHVSARLASAQARLADPAFVGKAPVAIVDGARRSLADLEAQATSLREKLAG